ncbi:MAG: hypothetical protein ACT4PT_00190 [Methanobacteriota archaeon]
MALWRGRPTLLLAAALVMGSLAGCIRGTDERGTPDAGDEVAALPNSLDVDLHETLLSITFPVGQPTALVLLNVTKEMWVRPSVSNPAGSPSEVPLRSEAYWVLCPWVQSFGLEDENEYWLRFFWVEGDRLEWAHYMGATGGRDGDGGHCATWVEDPYPGAPPGSFLDARQVSIAAAEPFDGTLAVLVVARAGALTASGTGAAERSDGDAPVDAPEFRVLLGIAREACADDAGDLCPPSGQRSASPLLRAGPSVFGACAWYSIDAAPCRAFERRSPPLDAPLSVGGWSAARGSLLQGGLVSAFARHHGPAEFKLYSETVEGPRTISCVTGDAAGWAGILAPTEGPTRFHVAMNSTGWGWAISLFEIPIDFHEAGFDLEPLMPRNTIEGECES